MVQVFTIPFPPVCYLCSFSQNFSPVADWIHCRRGWNFRVSDLTVWKSCLDSSSSVKGKKGKGFPYSLPSFGPGADLGVQPVIPRVTLVIHPTVGCHYFPPGLRLPFQPQTITPFGWYSFYRPMKGRRLSRLGDSSVEN